jgi:hypothetical protein
MCAACARAFTPSGFLGKSSIISLRRAMPLRSAVMTADHHQHDCDPDHSHVGEDHSALEVRNSGFCDSVTAALSLPEFDTLSSFI